MTASATRAQISIIRTRFRSIISFWLTCIVFNTGRLNFWSKCLRTHLSVAFNSRRRGRDHDWCTAYWGFDLDLTVTRDWSHLATRVFNFIEFRTLSLKLKTIVNWSAAAFGWSKRVTSVLWIQWLISFNHFIFNELCFVRWFTLAVFPAVNTNFSLYSPNSICCLCG